MSAIIYARTSKFGKNGLSLDNQEYAIKSWVKNKNMSVFKILKEVGSAFKKNSNLDLNKILSSCKNKTLVVFEASRISRNTVNFKDTYNICVQNEHDIAIVNIDFIFNHKIKSNYEILYEMIYTAQEARKQNIEVVDLLK